MASSVHPSHHGIGICIARQTLIGPLNMCIYIFMCVCLCLLIYVYIIY